MKIEKTCLVLKNLRFKHNAKDIIAFFVMIPEII